MVSNGYNYINLSYLHLMADNDPGMVRTMLKMLLEELPFELGKMRHFASNEQWSELRATSHKMKSTLAFVGNEKLITTNRKIEQYAQDGTNLEDIPDLISNVESMTDHAILELRDALNKSQ